LWVIDAITKSLGGPVGEAFHSLLKHYNNLVQGIFDTSSLICLLVTLFWVSFSPLNQLICDFSVHD